MEKYYKLFQVLGFDTANSEIFWRIDIENIDMLKMSLSLRHEDPIPWAGSKFQNGDLRKMHLYLLYLR